MKFDVFISRKTADKDKADKIEAFLTEKGLTVFNSSTTIAEIGDSDYLKTIYAALYTSNNFIFIASSNIKTKPEWIEHECEVFALRRISKEARGNIVTMNYDDSIKEEDLFLCLRKYEILTVSKESNYLEKLLKFLVFDPAEVKVKTQVDDANILDEAKEAYLNLQHEEAFNKSKKAVKEGFAFGYLILGMMYLNGEYVLRDFSEAKKNFEKAIEMGCVLGYYGLAQLVTSTKGDKTLAKKYLNEVLDEIIVGNEEDPFFNNLRGNIYSDGGAVHLNISKAIIFYEKAIAEGNVRSLHNLGLIYAYGKGGIEKDIDLALLHFHEAAKSNFTFSFYELGRIYEFELKDLNEAVRYYYEGANRDSVECQHCLGMIYHNRHEFKDNNESFYWHMKAALQEHSISQNSIGYYYANGLGCEKSPHEALKWYEKAANNGNAMAMSNIGFIYAKNDGILADRKKAIEWFEKAADLGEECGLFNLALEYEFGEVLQKDLQKAEVLYLMAANKNYNLAQHKYAEILYSRNDYLNALDWYTKAANQNYSPSLFSLGEMYELSVGVTRDMDRAFSYYKKAAELKHPKGCFKVGMFYLREDFDKRDIPMGMEYLVESANLGDVLAQNTLGIIYSEGKLVKQDFDKAKYWYEKASRQGDRFSQHNLGLIYEFGQGVEVNIKNAKYYYDMSAKQGFDSAQYRIGLLYLEESNFREAERWFELAANQGHQSAWKQLESLRKR